jgi:hypothetical protein
MGVDFHLVKPADPEMISAVLDRLELLSSRTPPESGQAQKRQAGSVAA